jgi:serine/threonine protein kinase
VPPPPTDPSPSRCILYELATFKHAFDANNLPALVMNIVNGKFDVNPLQRYSPGVSELVRAMLQKNPDNRPDIPLLLEHPLVQEYREAAENGALPPLHPPCAGPVCPYLVHCQRFAVALI